MVARTGSSHERCGALMSLAYTCWRSLPSACWESGAVLRVVVDDTLFRRSGKRVAHAFWQHDGAGTAKNSTAFGNNFVVLGVIVTLPFRTRPTCLPILFRLYKKNGPSRAHLGNRLVQIVTLFMPERVVELVADAAYATHDFVQLPERVSFVSRLRSNAALHRLAPGPTGQRGRPRVRGERPQISAGGGKT